VGRGQGTGEEMERGVESRERAGREEIEIERYRARKAPFGVFQFGRTKVQNRHAVTTVDLDFHLYLYIYP
jgi:hypothetical protein